MAYRTVSGAQRGIMPITVEWNDKSQALIECRFSDPWSIAQFIQTRRSCHRMLKSADRPIPILLDLRQTHSVPAGALRHFGAMQRTAHPRQGQLIVLGLNADYRKLASFAFNGQTLVVDSLEAIPDL